MSGCDHCEGGWVKVADDYGQKIHPGPSAETLEGMAEKDRERLLRLTESIQATISNSVYPCRHCNEAAFWRWRGGHLESAHNRGTCDVCTPSRPRGRSPVMDPGPSEPERARADLA